MASDAETPASGLLEETLVSETEDGRGSSARIMSLEGDLQQKHRYSFVGKRVVVALASALALAGIVTLGVHSSQRVEYEGLVEANEEDSTDLLQIVEQDGKKYFRDCGNTYELEKVTHSNLGGHGPDQGDETIVWVSKHMYQGEFLGYVDIVMKANKPYQPWNDLSLNGIHGKFGRVVLPSGESLDATITFLDHETQKPITLPEITLTFYDIDQGWDHTAIEYVRVISDHKTLLHKDADIKVVDLADGSVEYTATEMGNKEDNPLQPDTLTELMKKRALAFTIDNAKSAEVVFGSSAGQYDRGFFFAFMNAINCHLVEITTTTTTTTTSTEYHPFPWWILAVIAAILLLILICILIRCYYRRLTFTERKTMVKNRFIRQVNRAAEILGGPNPNYNDPELKSILQKLNDNKQHVKALCGNQWVEWKAPGQCQVCRTDVDRKEKGLQCASGGHRICWNCMCHNMDWDAICEDELTHLKDDTDIYIWDCNQ